MNPDELLNEAESFKPKSGAFRSLELITTEDLTPFRGVHEFETCIQRTQGNSTYQNYFYFWQDMELSCQTLPQKNVLLMQLMAPISQIKKWPAPVYLLRLELDDFRVLLSAEEKMNFVISLNHRLLTMANSIANRDTALVCWSDRKIGRNPRSPGAMLASISSEKSNPKKSWWYF